LARRGSCKFLVLLQNEVFNGELDELRLPSSDLLLGDGRGRLGFSLAVDLLEDLLLLLKNAILFVLLRSYPIMVRRLESSRVLTEAVVPVAKLSTTGLVHDFIFRHPASRHRGGQVVRLGLRTALGSQMNVGVQLTLNQIAPFREGA